MKVRFIRWVSKGDVILTADEKGYLPAGLKQQKTPS